MASIRKRTTRQGENRYDLRYRTPDGAAREETFRTRREAVSVCTPSKSRERVVDG
jgi:hypothetical protein